MIKDTIEVNGIQVEIIEFKKEDTKEKVGTRPIIYNILTHIDQEDISIYWINRINKDFENNDDEFKSTINGIVENIGKDKIILADHGSVSLSSRYDVDKTFIKHILYEQDILTACGFYQIYFTASIPRHVNSLSIYDNSTSHAFLDMLINAGIIETILM